MSIVWEMYTNVPDAINNQEMGMFVSFGPSDIKAFHGMRDVGQEKYDNYFENMHYDEVYKP